MKDYIYQELFANPNKKFVLDVPLLFEANMEVVCDKVIFVDINKDNQIERLMSQ